MDLITASAALLIVMLATIWDFRENRIPNWLTLPAIPIGILWHTLSAPSPLEGLRYSLLGFAVGFGFFFILFAIGGGGGGDVKLMGALGAWLGMQTTIAAILIATVVVFLMLVGSTVMKAIRQQKQNDGTKHAVAFAVPMCLATITLVFVKLVAQ